MESHISYGLKKIYREIPNDLIHAAHLSGGAMYNGAASVESRVVEDVIRGVVMTDINVVSGTVKDIDLFGLPTRDIEHGISITVPKSLREGRDITSAMSASYGYNTLEPSTLGDPTHEGTSEVYLIGPNTIGIKGFWRRQRITVRVMLEHASGLENMPNTSKRHFGNMCVSAEKGFVYNTLVINASLAVNTGGSTGGAFREVLDSYSDAYEIYNEEHLPKWRKLSIMGDKRQYHRYSGIFISK